MDKPGSEEKGKIVKATGILAIFILLSRFLGVVRNQILSHFFGAGMVADAFIAAFTIPNALRRLFGEGAMTPAVVSIFTSHLKDGDTPEKRKTFASNVFFWLTVTMILIVGVGILFSPVFVNLYVPEFRAIPEKFQLTVDLTRFLFPFIIPISLSALFMGFLNTFNSFGISAAGQAILNGTVIILAPLAFMLFATDLTSKIYLFSGAILLGACIQTLAQLPWLKKHQTLPSFIARGPTPETQSLARILVPSIFSMGIYQLNIIVNRVFASSIEGAVSHLYFADLLVELPVALVATSVGMAAIPSFSRLVTAERNTEFSDAFHFSFELIAFLALPAAGGLFVLAEPLISSFFFSGKFTLEDSQETIRCLIGYGLGLPFFCLLRAVLPVYFAVKDTKTPMYVGFFALGVNFICAWKFSNLYGAAGIAVATSVSSFSNFIILAIILSFRHPSIQWRRSVWPLLKMCGATLGMCLLVLAYLQIPAIQNLWDLSGIRISKFVSLFGGVILGMASFLAFGIMLKLPQASSILSRILRR